MDAGRAIGDAMAAIALESEEDRMRVQYRAAMRVLRTIPSGTPDSDLTAEQREAWRLHDEAMRWFAQATNYETILAEARAAGEEHGRAAASWYFDGNTSTGWYASVLVGIEDGDPAILDTFPSAPLSGEWAGDPTPATVLADLDVDEDDPGADDYVSAYEDGFYEASARAIESEARAHLAP